MRSSHLTVQLLAWVLAGIGLCTAGRAQAPSALPREANPLDKKRRLPDLPETLTAPRSEIDPGSSTSPASTHLQVPAGSSVKITIEVGGTTNAAPSLPEPMETTDTPPEVKIPADAIDKIKPIPLPAIPDNPPPHEGKMLELPNVVEPPDLIIVEVLEALPGRPISGERLIRPDGMISLGFYGDLHVRGLTVAQVKEKIVIHLRKFLPDEVLGLVEMDEEGTWIQVAPKDSIHVMVDISAYNSKSYFVQGDVAYPGKLPCTGNETVLDALNYAGGFIPAADPKNIRLVRPGRNGKPSRVYTVDYEAILDRGESEKNYQLFPGDRLIVGRNATVKSTLELDRVASTLQTVYQSLIQQSLATRSMIQAASAGGASLTPAQSEALVREWADTWWKVIERIPGNGLDERTFRELLMKAVHPPAGQPGAADKPGGAR